MSLPLHADVDRAARGGGPRPVFVLLHGFAGDGGTWEPVRAGLRRLGPTVAIDLMGHGQSPAPEDPARYAVATAVDDLEAVLKSLRIESAWWIGYSMGGRIALSLALAKPHLVRGLVLESVSAGIAYREEREARLRADEDLARSILADGMEAFVERWLNQPMFAGLWRMTEQRFNEEVARRERQRPLGLANSLRGMGQGAMPPLWERLGEIAVPTLVVTGADDERYGELGSRLATSIPGAELARVPETTHAVHTEQPEAFLRAVTGFLYRQERHALAGLE